VTRSPGREAGVAVRAYRAAMAAGVLVIATAYALNPGLSYYIGGYFWWYAAEDVLHPGALLRMALRAAFRAEAAALG
jgi:hypothetical protein